MNSITPTKQGNHITIYEVVASLKDLKDNEGLCPEAEFSLLKAKDSYTQGLLEFAKQSRGQPDVFHFTNFHLSREAEGATHTPLDAKAISN